jgi:NADH-quinone oxidoreductase subunit N
VFKAAIAAGLAPAAVIALVGSVVAAFYYLRLIKTMWLDPPLGATDAPAGEARTITYASALFAFPLVMAALVPLYPAARAAAAALIQP